MYVCLSVDCVITCAQLGHNLPDSSGNRYCINLVSVAGSPEEEEEEACSAPAASEPSKL